MGCCKTNQIKESLENIEARLLEIEDRINLIEEKTRSKLDYLLKLIQEIKNAD